MLTRRIGGRWSHSLSDREMGEGSCSGRLRPGDDKADEFIGRLLAVTERFDRRWQRRPGSDGTARHGSSPERLDLFDIDR